MTINDIAKEAGVSAATVSMILNNKDTSISQETRAKVMAVVDAHGYVPHKKFVDKQTMPKNMVGVMLPNISSPFYAAFLEHFNELLQRNNYASVIRLTQGNMAQEIAALHFFSEQRLQCVAAFPINKRCIENAAEQQKSNKKLLVLDSRIAQVPCIQYYCDYKASTYIAMEHLMSKGCKRIALLLGRFAGLKADPIISGYKEALATVKRAYDDTLVLHDTNTFRKDIEQLLDAGVDAVICQDTACAKAAYAVASYRYFSIAKDLSVVCLEDSGLNDDFSPALTTVAYTPKQLAELAAKYANTLLAGEKNTLPFTNELLEVQLAERSSVMSQIRPLTNRILVIGRMNMDISLKVPSNPEIGKPLDATSLHYLPGGKGGNQAVGVAKLGGNAHMIGILGNDLYGKQLYEKLMQAGVDTSGIEFSQDLPTGTAYINMLPDGNSLIIGNVGANAMLNRSYIKKHAESFKNAKYCLIQMETDINTLTYIIELCREHSVKVIIKPNESRVFPTELYKHIEIFVPNKNELELMVPVDASIEEKAQNLVACGIKNVVVTMGREGCFWVSNNHIHHYKPTQNRCVDATGASDIFISCLAVMLSDGKDMDTSLKMANYAAGFSVMRRGVQNAIPERWMVENNYEEGQTT